MGIPPSPHGCAALHVSQSSLPRLPGLPGGHWASMRGVLCFCLEETQAVGMAKHASCVQKLKPIQDGGGSDACARS